MMNWDNLTNEQYTRLCECRSIKNDIVPIAKAYMINKSCDADDALTYTFEHLDMNGQFFDPTEEEYNGYLNELRKETENV